MAGNSIGSLFRLTSFGESHGAGVGGIIDGMPPGVSVDIDFIQHELDRRKPGQSAITTQRKEGDRLEILSGVFEGKTTGTPLAFLIHNENQKSKDYAHIKETYRPSHADYTYDKKYGIRDYRGGGRSSARETIARVVAGAFAKIYLRDFGISFNAYVSQIGKLKLDKDYKQLNLSSAEENIVRCPDPKLAEKMEDYVKQIRKEGDTVGGAINCVIKSVPVGLGEPVFDKLHADLAKAMLGINAVKGFEYGSGFNAVEMRGSEHNDLFNEDFSTQTNNSGGVQGGISNGEDIYFKVAFKPVATLMQKQSAVDSKGSIVEMEGKGRHDPCVVPRAVVIVEAMAALTIMDHFLRAKTYR